MPNGHEFPFLFVLLDYAFGVKDHIPILSVMKLFYRGLPRERCSVSPNLEESSFRDDTSCPVTCPCTKSRPKTFHDNWVGFEIVAAPLVRIEELISKLAEILIRDRPPITHQLP